MEALFRVVPPSLFLALGMTEKHEKAERRQLMMQHGYSELDAALEVAARIDKARNCIMMKQHYRLFNVGPQKSSLGLYLRR